MWNRKLTMYECPDREATIFVLQDDNENILAWDVCNHPCIRQKIALKLFFLVKMI